MSGPPEEDTAIVRREILITCVTCSLCDGLFEDATTISECLHTFCRKCIFDKLTKEEVRCCPKCNIDLGCVPVDKLRPDHILEDLRSKLFPRKRRKINEPEVPPISLPIRRRDRPTSFGVKAPTVVTHTCMRRRKTMAKRRLKNRSSKKKVSRVEDSAQSSSSSEILSSIISRSRRQVNKKSFSRWPSKHASDESKANGNGSSEDNYEDENDDCCSQTTVKRQHSQKERDLQPAAPEIVDVPEATQDGKSFPIWLSLLPTIDLDENRTVPQSHSCYLRIKDGSVPVSFIQKYLVQKLDLHSEAEVELTFCSEVLNPTLLLNDLADLWVQSDPSRSQKVHATIGASAEEFVMELYYRCKAFPP